MEPVGERHVVATVHQTATGKGSGIPVEMDMVYLIGIAKEKLVALHLYLTKEEAVEAAERRESARAD